MRDLLVGADSAKFSDETGFRVVARTQCLHVLGTRWLAFFHTGVSRSSLLERLRGCLLHDHWKPYFTVPDMQYALCNAHRLRELEVLTEIDGAAWARPMQQLPRMARQVAGIVREESFVLPPALAACCESAMTAWWRGR